MSKLISSDDGVQAWAVPEVAGQEEVKKASASLSRNEKKALLAQLEKSKKEGYDEGFQKGLQDGLAAAQTQVEQSLASFTSVMQHLANPIAQVEDQVEEQLVNLSVLIAKQIVRRELKADPGQVIAVVREALSLIPSSSQNVKVYLNPGDAELVRKIIPSNAGERKWEVVEDPVLSQGSCRVETDSAQIDASFEARLAAIAAEILGSERRQNDES